MSKEGPFLSGPGTSGCFCRLGEKRNLTKFHVKSDGDSLAWLLALGFEEFNLRFFMKSSSEAVLRRACMVNHHSCCTDVNNQAEFNKSKLVSLLLSLVKNIGMIWKRKNKLAFSQILDYSLANALRSSLYPKIGVDLNSDTHMTLQTNVSKFLPLF